MNFFTKKFLSILMINVCAGWLLVFPASLFAEEFIKIQSVGNNESGLLISMLVSQEESSSLPETFRITVQNTTQAVVEFSYPERIGLTVFGIRLIGAERQRVDSTRPPMSETSSALVHRVLSPGEIMNWDYDFDELLEKASMELNDIQRGVRLSVLARVRLLIPSQSSGDLQSGTANFGYFKRL